MNANLTARFSAVETLQRFRDRHPPGSARFDEIDHAIDLALQQRRVVDRFLVRNAIRDAERVVRRRRLRQRVTLESNYVGTVESDDTATSLFDLLHDPASPEAEVTAIQLTEQALGAHGAHPRSVLILECLIDGRTAREIAKVAGISAASAAKLSRQLKNAVAVAAAAALT